jgi:Na+/H+-dicarboxylate symporter
MRISPVLILSSLVTGLAAGIALAHFAPDRVESATQIFDPIGSLWLRALQMTIVPLVVSLLITGIVTSVAAARAGKLAATSILFFFAVLWSGAIMAALVTPMLLEAFPIPAAAAQALIGGLGNAAEIGEIPPFAEFIKAMVPTNPINAAANDAILPLIIIGIFLERYIVKGLTTGSVK